MKNKCCLYTTLYAQKKMVDLTQDAEMLADKVLENQTTKTESDKDLNKDMYIHVIVNPTVNT